MPSKQTAPRPARKPRKRSPDPPMKLGAQLPNGISASMYGLVERGLARRPKIAKVIRGTVEIRFKEDFAPVRVRFGAKVVLVEDAARSAKADLVIHGSLPDVVQLASAPLFGGVPNPADARGRAALARMAGGRVKIEGSPLLARRLLKLLEI